MDEGFEQSRIHRIRCSESPVSASKEKPLRTYGQTHGCTVDCKYIKSAHSIHKHKILPINSGEWMSKRANKWGKRSEASSAEHANEWAVRANEQADGPSALRVHYISFTHCEMDAYAFLGAPKHLYMRVCWSVRPSVRPSVHRSVRDAFVRSHFEKNDFIRVRLACS